MIIKKQMNILGEIWDIKSCKTREELDTEMVCDGLCIPKLQEIRIYSQLKQDRKEETFIHELLHTIIVRMDMRDLFEDKEEEIVTKLATGIYDTFKRNKII